MVSRKRPQVSSDREKWDKVFNGLVKLLKNQQEQLESLVKDRKLLEDRIKMQHERWVSDVRLYQDHIFQMREELTEKEMERLLEAAKSDLMVGLKQRDASLHKLKSKLMEDELIDLKDWFHCLMSSLKGDTENSDHRKGGRDGNKKSPASKAEVDRLRLEYEKLASEKNSEISALLKEKSFVWHQYNVLESNLTTKLKSKESEVGKANEKITTVIAHAEMLQASNNEKDETIEKLQTKLDHMEAETSNYKEQISKLSQELELLRKSNNTLVTPVLKPCNGEPKSSQPGIKCSNRDRSKILVKKEQSPLPYKVPSKDMKKVGRSSKRKATEVIDISETPKLFSPAFKVPKLKNSSTSKLFASASVR
ncbi:hypothetical protein K2173_027903 [Erythroxylum novogranatense]|uniref:Uncharacterized protein n=1 Tax=Erythroxylum novogranatense TaxID=1862640 RepID=A0AAV8U1N6_9ROSI|nr:hypothetical protein K2173_027903 [Erythroxylum novogranatense]